MLLMRKLNFNCKIQFSLFLQAGIYTAVENANNLRAEMGSYYDFFLKDTVTEPVFSIPYLDAFGTGKLLFKIQTDQSVKACKVSV